MQTAIRSIRVVIKCINVMCKRNLENRKRNRKRHRSKSRKDKEAKGEKETERHKQKNRKTQKKTETKRQQLKKYFFESRRLDYILPTILRHLQLHTATAMGSTVYNIPHSKNMFV
jgi:sRNA-binding protein